MLRRLRSIVLVLVFAVLVLKLITLLVFPADWSRTQQVVIYPVNADGRRETGLYIDALSVEHFAAIETFLRREAEAWQLSNPDPVTLRLASPLSESPPAPPLQGNGAEYLNWSLRIRFWSWLNLAGDGADIRIFMRFFSPRHGTQLDHSVGLEQGRIGLVNAWATIDRQPHNNYVAAHELLHTVGASDKYDLNSRIPHFPDGYAEPDRVPRLPQRKAEIMGGWIPVTPGHALMPDSLTQAVIGQQTAQEIGWR